MQRWCPFPGWVAQIADFQGNICRRGHDAKIGNNGSGARIQSNQVAGARTVFGGAIETSTGVRQAASARRGKRVADQRRRAVLWIDRQQRTLVDRRAFTNVCVECVWSGQLDGPVPEQVLARPLSLRLLLRSSHLTPESLPVW